MEFADVSYFLGILLLLSMIFVLLVLPGHAELYASDDASNTPW